MTTPTPPRRPAKPAPEPLTFTPAGILRHHVTSEPVLVYEVSGSGVLVADPEKYQAWRASSASG